MVPAERRTLFVYDALPLFISDVTVSNVNYLHFESVPDVYCEERISGLDLPLLHEALMVFNPLKAPFLEGDD